MQTIGAAELRARLMAEIKPANVIPWFPFLKRLDIKMLDFLYPLHTDEEIIDALVGFEPKPYVAATKTQVGFDCNSQADHMRGWLLGKDKRVAWAWSNPKRDTKHYFLVFLHRDTLRLRVIEADYHANWKVGKPPEIASYENVLKTWLFGPQYNLSKGYRLYY